MHATSRAATVGTSLIAVSYPDIRGTRGDVYFFYFAAEWTSAEQTTGDAPPESSVPFVRAFRNLEIFFVTFSRESLVVLYRASSHRTCAERPKNRRTERLIGPVGRNSFCFRDTIGLCDTRSYVCTDAVNDDCRRDFCLLLFSLG